MPSLLQSRKSKAEMKKSQDGQPPFKTSTVPLKAAQQPPEKERFEAGSTHPEKMSPSKDIGSEPATEPFPAFEDTPAIIDAHQQSRSAVKYMAHAKLGGNGEATGLTFSPTHPFMSRERHRQVSDEVNAGLSGLCIGMGMSSGNSGVGKGSGKKSLLHGLGKRIWGNGKGKRDAEVEVEVEEEVVEDSGDDDVVDNTANDTGNCGDGLNGMETAPGPPLIPHSGEQQQLEIIDEVSETGQESIRNGSVNYIPREEEQDNVSTKTAKPSRSALTTDISCRVKTALQVVEHDPLLWPSAIPFEKTAIFSLPQQWPVIRILNVPFTITKQEIVQFLGRRSRPLPTDSGPAIHIIMERSTGKTMDCFIEFANLSDAKDTLAWVNRGLENGQPVKLGSRYVNAEMSSQCELMKEMFPRAKCVKWEDGVPRVIGKKDWWSTGFTGFVTEEEMFLMIRNAESPNRSPFISRCLQRPYNFMISTLYKFPWYATALYRVKDRDILFTATHRLLSILTRRLHEMSHSHHRHTHNNNDKQSSQGLDRRLAIDLLAAGLQCPGFNDRQKYCLHLAATNYGIVTGTPPSARFWPFDTLARKGHAQESLVLKYAALIQRAVQETPLPNSSLIANTFDPLFHAASPFGPINLECHAELTFQDAVDLELSMVREIIAVGVKLLREEEAASAEETFEASQKTKINSPASTNMHISSVKEVIFQLLPTQWRAHHYGFDPESYMCEGKGSVGSDSDGYADTSGGARTSAAANEPKYANHSGNNGADNSNGVNDHPLTALTQTSATNSYPSALEQTTVQGMENDLYESDYTSYDYGPAELGHPRNRWSADLRNVDWRSADARRRSIGINNRPVSMPEPIAEDNMSLG